MPPAPAVSDFRTAALARAVSTGADTPDLVDVTDPDLNRLRLEILVTYGFLTAEQAHALLTAIVDGGTKNGLEPLPCPEELVLPVYNLIRGSLVSRPDSIDFVGEAIAIAEAVMYVADRWNEITGAVGDALDFISGLFG